MYDQNTVKYLKIKYYMSKQPLGKIKKIRIKIRKFFGQSDIENIAQQNWWDAAKAMLIGEFMPSNS